MRAKLESEQARASAQHASRASLDVESGHVARMERMQAMLDKLTSQSDDDVAAL